MMNYVMFRGMPNKRLLTFSDAVSGGGTKTPNSSAAAWSLLLAESPRVAGVLRAADCLVTRATRDRVATAAAAAAVETTETEWRACTERLLRFHFSLSFWSKNPTK
jgi:hypothetical protein